MYNGRHIIVVRYVKQPNFGWCLYNVAQGGNIHMQEAILSETPWGIIGLDLASVSSYHDKTN